MKEKIFILVQESCINGEILVNVTPCRTEKTAKRVMKQELATLKKYGHYAECEEGDLYIEETSDTYFMKDQCDDYYEYFKIEEKEIIERLKPRYQVTLNELDEDNNLVETYIKYTSKSFNAMSMAMKFREKHKNTSVMVYDSREGEIVFEI